MSYEKPEIFLKDFGNLRRENHKETKSTKSTKTRNTINNGKIYGFFVLFVSLWFSLL